MERRKFIKNTSAVFAGISILPRHVFGKGFVAPSDTLYVAGFGVGGRGQRVLNEMYNTKKVKFVAFCDVDDLRAKETFNAYPDVKKYKDFRKLYDKQLNDIDAIMVATPDHTHATIALPFMREKKHAYVEKPLTHNIYEARLMINVAKEKGIITQMGNQGASSDDSRQAKEWVESGIIGKVHTVDCWTNRPIWPQGIALPTDAHTIPKTLDWDLWLGPSVYRPYHPIYVPFGWRGWWDFGTGALGDMGCHIMETPYTVLDLGLPYEAEASCTQSWSDNFKEVDYSSACPASSKIHLKFKHPFHGDISLNWFDGGIRPNLPDELDDGDSIGDWGGGSVIYGNKGILVCDTYSKNARLLPSNLMDLYKKPEPYLKRIPNSVDGHVANFVDGCINGTPTSSAFETAGKLTEGVLIGNLAVKSYQYIEASELNKNKKSFNHPGRIKLKWDGDAMKITNFDKANDWVAREYRDGWELR